MSALKIIHAADLHLDSPFEALGERAAQRRSEQRELLHRLGALVEEKQADVLLLAGDLLDSGSTYAETAQSLCRELGELSCPVFIAPGNHDYYCLSSPYARLELPENVHVFRSRHMQAVTLPELGVRVWGAAFTDITSPPLLRGFSAEKIPGMLDVGLLHGDVGRLLSRYNPITTQEIAESGLNYLALGHQHSGSGLLRAGSSFYAWPGCAEGRGFDECGEKGVLYVEVEEQVCRAEFIPLAARRYEQLDFDISQGWSQVNIPAGAGRDIYRLVLRGETEGPADIPRLRELLQGRFYALEIVDKTTLRSDLWARAEQDSLRGLFLRKMRQRYDCAETEAEQESITRAVRWGLAALDGGEAVEQL